ncbi:MAG: hypothetical protein ACQES0_08775 [Bacteroidota bacterium]
MKRFLPLLMLALMSVQLSQAQVVGGYFDKLAEKYEAGEYEDCAFKADRMLNRNKYSGDPELYLYMAMSYHKISQDTALNKLPEYSKAYDNAVKNLVRAKRKDRYGEYFPDNNFVIREIVKSGIPVMLEYSREGRYSKTYSMLRSFERLTDDAGLVFYKSVMDFFNYNEREAEDAMYKYMPVFDSVVTASADYSKPLIADGMKRYFDLLTEDYLIDSAAYIIRQAYAHFPEDTAIKRRYDMELDSLRYE